MKFKIVIIGIMFFSIFKPAHSTGFINRISEIKESGGHCVYYAYAYTYANPGFLGSVSNAISGMGYGLKNGQYTTSYNGDPVTFTNQTPDREFTDGYPMSANISHSWAAALGGSESSLAYPYVYADCPTVAGGGDQCEGNDNDGGWSQDPYNQDPCDSPILIDLDNQAIACGGESTAIWFDLWGNGEPILINWIAPQSDDVFLIHDLNRNGIVDDGSELFGSGTRLLLEDRLALNGFLGLAQFDELELGGNGNSFIDPADMVWRDLYLWNDRNADGFSDPGELLPVSHRGLQSFDTIPKEMRVFDEHGNWFRFWASAESARSRHLMIDIFFVRH